MLIVTQRVGRLGNQVYLLAHLLAFSQATGIGFAHPTLREYGMFFKGTRRDALVRYPRAAAFFPYGEIARKVISLGTRLLDKTCFSFGRRLNWQRIDYRETFDLSNPEFLAGVRQRKHTWISGGWRFQYPMITDAFLPIAREFFALTAPYSTNVARVLDAARQGVDLLIGVHIRQTDFKEHAGGKFYFTTGQYASVMQEASRLFPGRSVRFLVVSDEPKTQADFPGLSCCWGTGVPIEDMYALGGCDLIISNVASSFSAWPSFLYQIPNYRVSDPSADFAEANFKAAIDPFRLVEN